MGNKDRFAGLSQVIRGTREEVTALDTAVKALGATVSEVAPAARKELAETGAVAVRVGRQIVDSQQAWTDQQLGMLERLKQLVIPFEGSDAGGQYSFDKIIQDQIDKVRSGQETATEAIHELQRQFGSVYEVIQRRFGTSNDPAEREFALLLEQFILSGILNS